MMKTLLILVLALGVAAAQPQDLMKQTDGHASPAGDAGKSGKSVSPQEPVITISGICGIVGKTANAPACKTSVTKEQFEKLVSALAFAGQQIPANERQQLAQTYVDLLAYEEAARSSTLESSAEFQDLMTFLRLSTLAEIQRLRLQAKYRTPSQEDIAQHYRQNPLNFTEVRLRRILVPRKNPSAANQQEYEKKALEVADGLRERAAQGEDFEQLQKEGYNHLALPSPPATDMGNRRRANLLPDDRDEVLALGLGEVSKVEQESFSFVIYKVEGKRLLPLEAVQEEISRELSKQRLDNALKEITSGVHAEFNQQYFGPQQTAPVVPSASSALSQNK